MYRMSWFPFAGVIENKEYIIFLVTFTIICLLTIDFDRLFNHDFTLLSTKNSILVLLFAIFFISTINFNTQELSHVSNFFKLISLFAYITLYSVIFPKFLVQNSGYFEKLVRFLSNLGFITAVFGIGLYFSGYKPNQMAIYLISFIRHPNGVSIILSLSVISTLYYLIWKKDSISSFSQKFYISSFAIQFIAELLTQSRTGILACVVSVSVFLLIYYRKKVIVLLPVIMAGINFFVLGYILSKGATSFFSRFRLWLVAYYLVSRDDSKLFWGYGFTDSNEIFKENAMIFTETVEHPHNAYISILLMFGLYFLIVFLCFLIFLLFVTLNKLMKSKDREGKLFYTFILSMFASFLFQGLFESPLVLTWYFLMPFFLIILGLMYLMIGKKTSIASVYSG